MRISPIIRALVLLLLVGLGYGWLRTEGPWSSPSSAPRDTGVEISFTEGRASSASPIVSVVDEHGSVLISNSESDIRHHSTAAAQASSSQSSPSPRQSKEAADVPLWSSTPWKSARENAEAHWAKHRREFPEYRSASEYIEAAHAFFRNPPRGTLTKIDTDGDKLFFNPSDGTFGVQAPDGAPRTMFRPRNGMEYWRRQ